MTCQERRERWRKGKKDSSILFRCGRGAPREENRATHTKEIQVKLVVCFAGKKFATEARRVTDLYLKNCDGVLLFMLYTCGQRPRLASESQVTGTSNL